MIKVPDGTLRILVQGLQRVRLVEPLQEEPYLPAELEELPDIVPDSPEVEALTRNVQHQFAHIIGMTPYLPEELQLAAANVDDPSALCHLIASTLRLKTDERQELLELVNVEERLRAISLILSREVEMSELGSRIQSQVASEIDKGQREFFLRQQLKAIQDELGEGDEQQAEINELRGQIEEKNLPEHVLKAATRELARLEKLPPAAAEYGVIRTYLDWIISLPWTEFTEDDLDLEHARQILDEDHFDLEKVKERIIEYLAVSKLKNDLSGPILCFVGPPGVGKTSLGQSIARALGRNFARISVGGVRDESEIRGHRRTYIGAMPGTIIRAIRDAESANPVFLIDEIDKMGSDFRGDPASAMLEVLDPEQHSSFRDHYLDLPFDLSKVLFICTANTLDTIPRPAARPDGCDPALRLHVRGEARDREALPRPEAAEGARAQAQAARDPRRVLRPVITEYTREAGVRNLDRQIATLCRKAATLSRRAATRSQGRRGAGARVARPAALLRRRAQADIRPRSRDRPCLHEVGGDVLFIEATAYPGEGKLTITGQLGEVMQESAQAALSWIRSHTEELGARAGVVHRARRPHPRPRRGRAEGRSLGGRDDGHGDRIAGARHPGRGRRRDDRRDHADRAGLPIGGVREKVLAAQRAGLKRVILPHENVHDLDDLPPETRRELDFVLVDHVEEVLDDAFTPKGRARRARHRCSSGARASAR